MAEITQMVNLHPNSSSTSKGKILYPILWLLSNALIWGATYAYLKYRPVTYTSKWSINVPAAASTTNVSVPEIGQAVSSNDSPYKSFADPRESYKFLAESDEILELAAKQVNMDVEKFNRPRVKIIDNTTLMKLDMKGKTPKQALQKARAVNIVLQRTLNKLRLQETSQQDENLETAIKGDEKKLQAAKQQLFNFKVRSPLSSESQLHELSTNLEGLRRQRAETFAELKQTTAKVEQLSKNLGLSPQEAADALTLQSDRVFQQYLVNFSQKSSELSNLSAKLLPTNPIFITKQEEQQASYVQLLRQGQSLLGRPVSSTTLKQIVVNGSGSAELSSQRTNLFQELISLQVKQQGVKAQAQELEQQIAQLESRLNILSQQGSRLGSLERDVKIAEAVFSSNSTKLNLSRSDVSISYPRISIVTPPSLAKEPDGPKPILVMLGSGICSFFLTTGLIAQLIRNRKFKQVNTNPVTNGSSSSNNGSGHYIHKRRKSKTPLPKN
jgi:uncharacterized protein involved in exopolysaccharide biosynthesis